MNRNFLTLAFTVLLLSGCVTQETRYLIQGHSTPMIKDYKFEATTAVDPNSSTKVIELKPSKLPYTGSIAALTANDRWLEMMSTVAQAIKEDCGGNPKKMPLFKAEELDYSKFDKNPNHPAYIQARYECR